MTSPVARSAPATPIPAWFRLVYVAGIGVLSLESMHSAPRLADHRFWLAAIEILMAVLLLVRPLQRPAMIGLLAVYGVAALHAVVVGQLPASLVIYAATAVLIGTSTSQSARDG